MGNGIVLSATVAEHSTCSSFMPVSRIISRCPTVCKVIQLDHMKDKVCISIPVGRHYLFFKTYFYSIFSFWFYKFYSQQTFINIIIVITYYCNSTLNVCGIYYNSINYNNHEYRQILSWCIK